MPSNELSARASGALDPHDDSLTLLLDNSLVLRKGRVFVINRTTPRFKARQG